MIPRGVTLGLRPERHRVVAQPSFTAAASHLESYRTIMDGAAPGRCGAALSRLLAAQRDLAEGSAHLASGGRTVELAERRRKLTGKLSLAAREFRNVCVRS